ncbi:MAG TPA: bestrophin family ion channel [Pyrinomonadaceae bacterium]|nr:bestrophin family ion channel [Pyrinomonadaceae bacterium]
MFTGLNYPIKDFLIWTRREIFFLLIVSAIPTAIFALTGWKWLGLPWVPIGMLGTAVAFVVGFKNNASYARVWEARTAWGAIINASRAFGVLVIDFAKTSDENKREIIDNHLAWLTALRFQLREPRGWETMSKVSNIEYRKKYFEVEEQDKKLLDELPKYLSDKDFKYIAEKKNRATQILHLQAQKISELTEKNSIDMPTEMRLQEMLVEFYRQQGVCERIKNFPYPRQFATLNLMFVKLFIILVPFGMLQEFNKLGEYFFWLTIPVSALIGWVFISLERSGDATENPFEGSSNDVPITQIARNIEIDLLDMLDEKELPPAIQPKNNIVM